MTPSFQKNKAFISFGKMMMSYDGGENHFFIVSKDSSLHPLQSSSKHMRGAMDAFRSDIPGGFSVKQAFKAVLPLLIIFLMQTRKLPN